MKALNQVFAQQPVTIFTRMSSLAANCGAINLGQGFPDGEGPDALRAAAARYLREGPNQYPPMAGIAALRGAVADHDRRFYGLAVDGSQVLVTSGATEALTASFLALLSPGDEAVLIEPVYDSYRPMIEQAGGVVRPVRLSPPDWSLSATALAGAVSDRTKLIVVNTPMNPIGKVFSRAELQLIAAAAVSADAYVVADEVYEHLIFDGHAHHTLLSFPGMENRALRIASAGKTFSLTGWKVGYVTACPELVEAVAKVHQFLTFTTPPALQRAVADGLAFPDSYFRGLAEDLQAKRDRLAAGLSMAGFRLLDCQGTYFLTADISGLAARGEGDEGFCERITREAKVAAIPLSAFYSEPARAPQNLVRFCFCKEAALLDEAARRLTEYFG